MAAFFSLGTLFKDRIVKRSASEENLNRLAMDKISVEIEEEVVIRESYQPASAHSPTELTDQNANSYISMLSNLIWNRTTDKPSDGPESWVPSDPEVIAQMPELMYSRYKRIHPSTDSSKNGDFAVYVYDKSSTDSSALLNYDTDSGCPDSSNESRPSTPIDQRAASPISVDSDAKKPLHHLLFTFWKGSKERKHVLSLFRSNKVTDVVALCERCRECSELFRINLKGGMQQEYLGNLLSALREHVLWKPVHIASCLGVTSYFKQISSQKLNMALRVQSQPEGMTAFMIAVEYDRLDLVSHLLDLHADTSVLSTTHNNNLLHFAGLKASAEMVELLLGSGRCDNLLNVANADGCSPLYLAVMSGNGFCAKALISHGAKFTASTKKTSLLLDAMKKSKMDVCTMQSIFDACPDALKDVDPLTGNGALHSAAFKRPLLALLELKAHELHLDQRNLLMQTPLHVFVTKGELSLVMAIVAYNIDLNAKDNNGNTPLHLAVSNLHLQILRALLCFGADPNAVNNHLETPRHLAAKFKNDEVAMNMVRSLIVCGAKSCPAGFVGCAAGCVHKDNFIGEPKVEGAEDNWEDRTRSEEENVASAQVDPLAPTSAYEFELDPEDHVMDIAYAGANPVRSYPQENAMKRVLSTLRKSCAEKKKKMNAVGDEKPLISVLSLDGGGIKGLVMVQILLCLQKHLNAPIFSYFDWVAGTSTGSYVASALATGKSLEDCQRIYLRFKDVLFDSWTRPYNAACLEEFVQKVFGERTMADVKYPRLFFTTVRADSFPVQLELLRNYRLPLSEKENEELGFEDPSETPIWLATRRSSAAPTYFSASEGKFIDGGMVSNNPTLDLLSEITFWNSTCSFSNKPASVVDVGCVVSIGTGITPVYPVDPALFEMNDMFGMVRGLRNLSMMVLDQVTATEGAPISRSRSWCHSLGIPYFRLNAPLFKDIVLDCNEDCELVKIMWDTVVYSHTHRKDFEDLANLLKSIGTSKSRKKLLIQ